jgi:hypothetical protein
VKGTLLLAAVALGHHDDRVPGSVLGAGDGALEEERVGLLAGLEDPEVGVDGGLGGHDPVGPRLGSPGEGLDAEPGAPALGGLIDLVAAAEVEDEGRVDAGVLLGVLLLRVTGRRPKRCGHCGCSGG